MNTGKSIGPGESKINPLYKAEIKGFASSSNELFAGHTISWTALGDSPWEQAKNYIYSHISSEYADAVREVFWEEMNTKMSKLARSYQVHKSNTSKPENITRLVQETGKALKEIMESENLTEAQKMELVLKAVGADTEKFMKETVIGVTTAKQDTENFKNLLKEADYDYVEKAIRYFDGKKEKILLLTMGINLPQKNEDIARDTDIHSRFLNEKITSQEDLNAFTKNVIEALINECDYDEEKLAILETNINKLLTENPAVTFSPDEQIELSALIVQEPAKRAMVAIDEMLERHIEHILQKSEITELTDIREKHKKEYDAIKPQEDLKALEQEYKNLQLNYAKEAIKQLAAGCGTPDQYDRLNDEIAVLLENNAFQFSRSEKNELIKLVPRNKFEALSKDTIVSKQEAAKSAIIAGITHVINMNMLPGLLSEVDTNFKSTVSSQDDVNNYINDLIKAAIDGIAEKGDHSSLEKDVTELLNHPAITLSVTQKKDLLIRAKIATMRRNTMDLLILAEKNVIGTAAVLGQKAACEKIPNKGNLKKVEADLKAIQQRCIKMCIETMSYFEPKDRDPLTVKEILVAATLLSDDEKKPFVEEALNAPKRPLI